MKLFDREPLIRRLFDEGGIGWPEAVRDACATRYMPSAHGDMPGWIAAVQSLPDVADAAVDAAGAAVRLTGSLAANERERLVASLAKLHPWRKGPFDFFGTLVDAEWRSDLKWSRIAPAVSWKDKRVIDVGCGNGYYGWRMVDAGSRLVLGCDPHPLYNLQYEAAAKYASRQRRGGQLVDRRNWVVPLADTELPEGRRFDIAVSMGVLYHRTSPIDHLRKLAALILPGGELVLETLVLEAVEETVLVPEDRYAQMRNVWFIPSMAMLLRWLRRSGFADCRVVDCSLTTAQEQRRTEWMRFASLADFLDPEDPSRTVEGYPAPRRAVITARAV